MINKKLSDLTGYTKDKVMGNSLNIFLNSEIHEKHKQYLVKYFSNPHSRPMVLEMNSSAKRKDNTTFPVEISLSALKFEIKHRSANIKIQKNIEVHLQKLKLIVKIQTIIILNTLSLIIEIIYKQD